MPADPPPPPPAMPASSGTVTIPANRDTLWRFAALGVLLLVVPTVALFGDGHATLDDTVLVALALLLSVVPWFGVAMLLTMRLHVTPDRLTFHGLNMAGRVIARCDLARIQAERRALLTRGAFFPRSAQLQFTLTGQDAVGEAIDLRLSGMMLDTGGLLLALTPWIALNPMLVADDATRETLASLASETAD